MQATEHLEKAYEEAHIELNQLYKTFHDIPGYIRAKTGEELALQKAKKAFGRFIPNDLDLMESNTNNGQGFTVELEDGKTLHLNNQLELYNKVVAFNKSKGGFCDENFIEHTNVEDYKILMNLQFNVEVAKDALVDAYPDKKSGYAKAREIEKNAQASIQTTPKSTNTAASPDNTPRTNNTAVIPPQTRMMRIPLLSSIPNTFRQAKTLFNTSGNKQKGANRNLSSYVSQTNKNHDVSLAEHFDANIATAQNINEVLNEPVSDKTLGSIKTLCDDFDRNNKAIDELVGGSADIDKKAVDAYSDKIKQETDEMNKRAQAHPLLGIKSLIGNVIAKTLETLKGLVGKTLSFITNQKSPDTSTLDT